MIIGALEVGGTKMVQLLFLFPEQKENLLPIAYIFRD